MTLMWPSCDCCSGGFVTHRYYDSADGEMLWEGDVGRLFPVFQRVGTYSLANLGAQLKAVAIDSTGAAIVAGHRCISTLDPSKRATVWKYSSAGTLLWEYDHGDTVSGLAVDMADNVYLVGAPVVPASTAQTFSSAAATVLSSDDVDFRFGWGNQWIRTPPLGGAQPQVVRGYLEQMTGLEPGRVSVTGGPIDTAPVTITFDSSVADQGNPAGDVPLLYWEAGMNFLGGGTSWKIHRNSIPGGTAIKSVRKLNSSGVLQWSANFADTLINGNAWRVFQRGTGCRCAVNAGGDLFVTHPYQPANDLTKGLRKYSTAGSETASVSPANGELAIHVDLGGNLYLFEPHSFTVRKRSSALSSTWATGIGTFVFNPGPMLNAGIGADGFGRVYLAYTHDGSVGLATSFNANFVTLSSAGVLEQYTVAGSSGTTPTISQHGSLGISPLGTIALVDARFGGPTTEARTVAASPTMPPVAWRELNQYYPRTYAAAVSPDGLKVCVAGTRGEVF